MATHTLTFRAITNRRRADAIMQEAAAALRRAPKRDRDAMVSRYIKRIARECVRIVAQ